MQEQAREELTFQVRLYFSFPVGLKPRPSTTPPTKSKYRKSPYAGGRDRRGGGLVLDCHYIIEVKCPSYRSAVVSELRSFLDALGGDEHIL